nr:TetR/AcrR family transcriptional regulator [Rhodococcus sp. (in: high G+C Gram-positive bacteria)]
MSEAFTDEDPRTRIVTVAARLLREDGPGAVTTRGVAQAAGVQPPTIYRLFGDKDGLLEAVAEHVMASFVAAKSAVVDAASADGIDPLQDLHTGWQSQIEFGVANPDLFRLLSDPGRAMNSAAARTGMRVLEARVRRVAETGRLRVSEQRAVGLIHAAGVGVVTTLLASRPDLRDEGLAEDIYAAVLARVLFDAPQFHDGSEMATTVAFRALVPELEMLSSSERQLMSEWLDRAVSSLDRRS